MTEGSSLTVAGAAAALENSLRTAFPFDPQKEPSRSFRSGRRKESMLVPDLNRGMSIGKPIGPSRTQDEYSEIYNGNRRRIAPQGQRDGGLDRSGHTPLSGLARCRSGPAVPARCG